MTRPSTSHGVLLSSIASTDLRKIIIRGSHTTHWRRSTEGVDGWTWVDERLCRLVDRLRVVWYRHTLEAELRFERIGKLDFTRALPEFKEKGAVTILCAGIPAGTWRPPDLTHRTEVD